MTQQLRTPNVFAESWHRPCPDEILDLHTLEASLSGQACLLHLSNNQRLPGHLTALWVRADAGSLAGVFSLLSTATWPVDAAGVKLRLVLSCLTTQAPGLPSGRVVRT